MEVIATVVISIGLSLLIGLVAITLCGASRGFDPAQPPNSTDGAITLIAMLVAFMIIGSTFDPAEEVSNHEVKVHDLGVVHKITNLSSNFFESHGYHIARFERIGNDAFPKPILITCEYFLIPTPRYERFQKQFVPGKEYVMTCREKDGFNEDEVLSFYPKQGN